MHDAAYSRCLHGELKVCHQKRWLVQWAIVPRNLYYRNGYSWLNCAPILHLNIDGAPKLKECFYIQYWLEFIHSFKDLYSTSSRKLLRGAPDSSTVKKNSFQLIIECV